MRRRAAARTVLLVLLVALILTVALAPGLAAQTPSSRVMHLWVDPVHGNDALAVQQGTGNPIGNAECGSLSVISWPADVADSAGNALLHASYPFRTIKAAVAYVPTLPYVSPTTGYRWEYAIVHLMPGRYAKDPVTTRSYRDNNQYGNGEVFPIDIPDRVSIQGASALNTVIDVRYFDDQSKGPVFRFGETQGSTGLFSFIDSVAFTGTQEFSSINKEEAAAIYVSDKFALDQGIVGNLAITNCVFYACQIGILVRSSAPDEPFGEVSLKHKGITIMNNTFAWNRCGIWNGYWPLPTGATHAKGESKLIVINNLFDASAGLSCPLPLGWPLYGQFQSSVDFEGLDGNDMTIQGAGLPWGGNFNAYEPNTNTGAAPPNMFNTGTALVGSTLPPTLPRSGTPGAPTGNVPNPPGSMDIGPLTAGTQRGAPYARGVLFIRDLVCNGKLASQFQSGNPGHDGSPHDFRLSPAQLPSWLPSPSNPTPNAPGALDTSKSPPVPFGKPNQLIDAGWWGTLPVQMKSNVWLTLKPGTLPLGVGNSTWSFDAMHFDMEGYANPRVWDHPLIPNTGVTGAEGAIDIGADECGSLIYTGFRYGTTNYYSISSANLPAPTSALDQKYLWRVGLPTALFPTGFALRNVSTPLYRSNLSGMPAGASWTGSWWFVDPPNTTIIPGPMPYYLPFLVDITPHLLPDYHPWHQYPLPGRASFPVWRPCATGGYNAFLYLDPLANVINAPGSYIPLSLTMGVFNWLDALGATAAGNPDFQFFAPTAPGFGHANSPVASGPKLYTNYDEWCRGWRITPAGPKFATLRPTFTPNPSQPLLYTVERYTLENSTDTPWEQGLAGSNLQTFRAAVAGGQ